MKKISLGFIPWLLSPVSRRAGLWNHYIPYIENKALASLEEVKKETKNLQVAAEKVKELARFSEKMNGQLEDWLEAIKADGSSHNEERELESNKQREQITSLNLPENQVKFMDETFNTSETKSGKTIKNRLRYKT